MGGRDVQAGSAQKARKLVQVSAPQRRLVSIVVAFALGFGLAWILRAPAVLPPVLPLISPDPAATVPAVLGEGQAAGGAFPAVSAVAVRMPSSSPPMGNAASGSANVDALWRLALKPDDGQGSTYAAQDQLRKLAQADPTVRRSLIGFYDTARTAQERALVKATLATVQTPDIVFFANRLVNSSNVADRLFGFEMLQGLAPDTPETRALVTRTLVGEQAPEVVLVALATLRSGAAAPDETAQVVAQLTNLSQHADPAVRSRSIAQLALWDKSGESGERLTQALTDDVPEVRQAAIFAIAQASVRPSGAKDKLLALAGNIQESRDVRGSALQALERYPFSREEYAEFARLRAQLGGMP
jgi:hypothetical protein